MSFLQLEKLRKVWPGGAVAVNGVELAVARGEFVVLLGPSGCGKTTTLRMVAGLELPSGGTIRLDGRDITRLPASERDIGMVFQFYALYPHLTVAENIAFPLECAGVPRAERLALARALAERLELTALLERRPRALSGGDQQRVALARAMARKPAVWLMDEPLGTLDSARRAEMCDFLRAQQLEHGVATVYVTHDQDEAMRLADRIVVMSAGEILQVGPPHEVYDEPAGLFVARFVGSPGMNLLEARSTGRALELAGARAALHFAREVAPGNVVLGLRPEYVRLAASGVLTGRVALDAFMGSHRYVHVETPAGRVVALASIDAPSAQGEQVGLEFDLRGVRLFDPASGSRIA
ncbi:MAG: ABC transporter ATP-binding protein [Planctomycetes bacterium]|nr:ABC transporter ATP-binding protein [Planctomycetota bacterium]